MHKSVLDKCTKVEMVFEKDYPEAVRLFRLAADVGNNEGLRRLGLMYENGHGVEKDSKEAVRRYRLAANAGNVLAQVYLDYKFPNGLDASKN